MSPSDPSGLSVRTHADPLLTQPLTHEALQAAFGTDAAFGIDPVTGRFPNGTSSVFCTNYAEAIRDRLGRDRVNLVGFFASDNPNCVFSRERWDDGHDFAIIDHRWLVDPWACLVFEHFTMIYDLDNDAQAREALRIYGDPRTWEPVLTSHLPLAALQRLTPIWIAEGDTLGLITFTTRASSLLAMQES